MERRKFDASRSSNIESIEYDGSELLVEFKKGSVYAYSDVPKEVFDAFVNLKDSESIGKLFREKVLGKYNYRKVSSPVAIKVHKS